MTRDPGGQEVRVAEVFVECAEKIGFPGFGFSGRATTTPCGGEDGSRRKKCNSRDQRMAAGSTDSAGESKMEISVSSFDATGVLYRLEPGSMNNQIRKSISR